MNRTKSYKYPYCLCIIDMQPIFKAMNDVLAECIDLIQQAIADGAYVIVVQYMYPNGQSSSTHQSIRAVLSSYGNRACCWANQNDKSDTITRAVYANNVYTNTFVFCGVNTDACVHDTVNSFSSLHPEKTIILKDRACATTSGRSWHNKYVADMGWLHNVKTDSPHPSNVSSPGRIDPEDLILLSPS